MVIWFKCRLDIVSKNICSEGVIYAVEVYTDGQQCCYVGHDYPYVALLSVVFIISRR